MTLGIFGNGGAGCVAGDDTQGPMHRRLALAGVGETAHGITSRVDEQLAEGFGHD